MSCDRFWKRWLRAVGRFFGICEGCHDLCPRCPTCGLPMPTGTCIECG